MSLERSSDWTAQVELTYHRLGKELWALFYAHCADPDRAYDALQESFVRLQEHPQGDIRDVRAWLLQVGRNWMRDVARRQRVAARPADHLDDLSGRQQDAQFFLEREELRREVREALGQLRNEDREVLVLRYSLAWSSQQIAVAIGSTPSAVDMRLSRARRRLAELLAHLDPNNDAESVE